VVVRPHGHIGAITTLDDTNNNTTTTTTTTTINYFARIAS
jgi:hypothetical protein